MNMYSCYERHDSSISAACKHPHKLTIFPELRNKLVSGLVEQRGHVVIERVHVLHQPLVGLVVHLRGRSR